MVWEWPLSLGRGMPLLVDYDPATDAATGWTKPSTTSYETIPGSTSTPKLSRVSWCRSSLGHPKVLTWL